jgi:hypothetical protein
MYEQCGLNRVILRSNAAIKHSAAMMSLKMLTFGFGIMGQSTRQELVQYIMRLTERRTPPTREMIRSFASAVAHQEVSSCWVTRFINRNSSHLISHWQTRMDRKRHKADFEAKYSLYFDLLHDKIKEYNVEARHIYNIDKKGFMIGVTGRSKRLFDKGIYDQKGVTAAVQDGSRVGDGPSLYLFGWYSFITKSDLPVSCRSYKIKLGRGNRGRKALSLY